MARRFLFAWRHAIASEEGPARTFDRAVGLVMSLYMNADGNRCWANQDTIALRTASSDRGVGLAQERLCNEGWLSRKPRKSPRGIPHRRYGYEYRATLPKRLSNALVKGERRSLFTGKDPRKQSTRTSSDDATKSNGERHAISMANVVRTNSVEELAKSDAFKREPTQDAKNRAVPVDPFVADIEAAEARERAAA